MSLEHAPDRQSGERVAEAPRPALDLIWGAEAIAEQINRPVRTTFYLLETRQLPAKKCGGRWCASREALRQHFAVPSKTTEAA